MYVFASVFSCIYSKKSILLAKSFSFIQRKSDIKHVQLIKMLMSIWKMYEWKMKTQMPEVLFGIYGNKIKLILWLLRLKKHVSFFLLYKKTQNTKNYNSKIFLTPRRRFKTIFKLKTSSLLQIGNVCSFFSGLWTKYV